MTTGGSTLFGAVGGPSTFRLVMTGAGAGASGAGAGVTTGIGAGSTGWAPADVRVTVAVDRRGTLQTGSADRRGLHRGGEQAVELAQQVVGGEGLAQHVGGLHLRRALDGPRR